MKLLPACISLLVLLSGAHAETPLVIAHRGASGYLPEHTLEAKALAFAMGADYLEQDLVLSNDDVPMVMHDIHLDTISDVAKKFPGRQRADGRFYAIDFTLAEIKQLHATERIDLRTGQAVFPGRFPAGKSSFQIPTLEEELEFIAGLNKSTGRTVGIYPEIKKPAWHRKEGRDISSIVLPILDRHGYRTKGDPCWLQCFEYDEVKRLRGELHWKGHLLMLLGAGRKGDDGSDFAFFRSPDGLRELAGTVDGIGPAMASVIGPDGKATNLVRDGHAAKLLVHPYIVRADELPKGIPSLDELHRLIFVDAGIDGVFTDFPDKTAAFLRKK